MINNWGERRRLRQEVSRAERLARPSSQGSTAFSYYNPVSNEFNNKRWRGERRQAAFSNAIMEALP